MYCASFVGFAFARAPTQQGPALSAAATIRAGPSSASSSTSNMTFSSTANRQSQSMPQYQPVPQQAYTTSASGIARSMASTVVPSPVPSATGVVIPDPATYKARPQPDHLVEQYYCTKGPNLAGLDLNTFRGVPGMNYKFPVLKSNEIRPVSETTFSSGLNGRMRSELPSIGGGQPAPDPVRIIRPTWAPPSGTTQRFRESKMFQNGEYLGPDALSGATDFRPQTPEEVSFSPVVSRTYTRFDAPQSLKNDPFPVHLHHNAGSMFTHYSKREFKPSR